MPDRIEIDSHGGTLRLALRPEQRRRPDEPSGSFGGLALPSNVAFGLDGTVYLLDTSTLTLKRFDPCECRFDTLGCFGGAGDGPRGWQDPHGIAICGNNLYVCDTGNHRVGVYALHGLLVRTFLVPPDSAGLTNEWEPFDAAFDSRGRLFVTDPANGCVHRFGASGRYEGCVCGQGVVTHIAIDRGDRIIIVREDMPDTVSVIDDEGTVVGAFDWASELAPHIRPLSVQVDREGNLYLKMLCAEGGDDGVFDLQGNPVKAPAVSPMPYEREGLIITEALDSGIHGCQWHRIVLASSLPGGSSIMVLTFTADTEQELARIQALPDSAWATNRIVRPGDGGAWDCLIRGRPGRYLWLMLRMIGKGTSTPEVERIRIEYPRISLRRYLPAVYSAEPVSADFLDRFLGLFDTTLRGIENGIDTQARLFDPLSTPSTPDPKTGLDFLTWLASWIGVSLNRQCPEPKRRTYLKREGRLAHIRGTREGLWRKLLLFLDMEPEKVCCPDDRPKMRCMPKPRNCRPAGALPCAWQPPPLVLEHYRLRRWLYVGAGRLGNQSVLWGKRIVNRSQLNKGAQVARTQVIASQDPFRDPFHVYAHKFTVFVPSHIGTVEARRRALENIIEEEKPAHTAGAIEYVKPRYIVGFQSMIGFDGVIGDYPAGVITDRTRLANGSILTDEPHKRCGPPLQVGKTGRIGSSTNLG